MGNVRFPLCLFSLTTFAVPDPLGQSLSFRLRHVSIGAAALPSAAPYAKWLSWRPQPCLLRLGSLYTSGVLQPQVRALASETPTFQSHISPWLLCAFNSTIQLPWASVSLSVKEDDRIAINSTYKSGFSRHTTLFLLCN